MNEKCALAMFDAHKLPWAEIGTSYFLQLMQLIVNFPWLIYFVFERKKIHMAYMNLDLQLIKYLNSFLKDERKILNY